MNQLSNLTSRWSQTPFHTFLKPTSHQSQIRFPQICFTRTSVTNRGYIIRPQKLSKSVSHWSQSPFTLVTNSLHTTVAFLPLGNLGSCLEQQFFWGDKILKFQKKKKIETKTKWIEKENLLSHRGLVNPRDA